MERKHSIVAAGIITGGLLVASAAYALTAGVLTSSTGDGAGNLAPVVATADATPTSVAPTTTAPTAGAAGPEADDGSGTPPPTTATVSGTGSTAAERYDDGEHETHDDSHEAREYEGRDDDD